MIKSSAFSAGLLSLLSACGPDPTGGWSVAASCPAESQVGEKNVTATATMKEVGKDRFAGTIVNSLGQTGTIDATLDGDALAATVAWQGSGTTEALLIFDRRTSRYSGTDTEGCTLSVRRPG
jgi:hypothetical protein